MLSLILIAQLAVMSPPLDSTYSTPALRSLVERAAVENHAPPAALKTYRSHIETEMSLLIRDTLGREQSVEIEQLASDARWHRGDGYDLHVIGYRAQNVGVPYSALSLVRGWTVPTLYGERLSLGAYFGRAQEGDTLVAVHPFAADRDRFYRFSGGDTVATLRAGARTISVARIRVRPLFTDSTRLAAFDGEIDLDAERAQIIRMRGQLVVAGQRPTRRTRLVERFGVVTAAYVEFVNAEIDGAYWLPTFQRTEFQASFPILGQTRPVFRLVSSIGGIVANDTTVDADSLAAEPNTSQVSVTWALADSVSAYGDWQHDIGALTAANHADDFNDIAPVAWRAEGAPRLDLFPPSMSRVLRFNRVEGLFTGIAPSIDFRSEVPGLRVGVFAGWAWSEHTARGGAFVSYRTPRVIYGIHTDRALASTNDFVPPLSDDPGLGALFASIDDYDYVDRRRAMVSATRVVGSFSRALATVEAGVEDDRPEAARLTRGIITAGTRFRPNRGVTSGTSLRGAAELEIHPNVSGEFAQPGIGVRLRFDIARGDLAWSGLEARLSVRKNVRSVSLVTQLDGGAVFAAHVPPQRLFELGGTESLPGYDYKQFAGDRAALFRVFASYRLPRWRRPLRVGRTLMLPGLSPGIAVGAQGGWSELSSAGAREAAGQLTAGTGSHPPEATNGVRSTVGGGITMFSDLLHVGLARPVDHGARLRLVVGFGATF